MMGLKNLVVFLFMMKCVLSDLNTANPLNLKPSKTDFDAAEDLLKEALIEEITSEIYAKESNDSIKSEENKTNSEIGSESRVQGSWIDMEGVPPPLFEDPNENDVLNSREAVDFNKREEYFESLEKKSQRSTYIPPPRKNFYATSEEMDTSASEESFDNINPNNRRPVRIEDHTEDFDSKKRDDIADVIHAASDPFMDALHLASHPFGLHQRTPIEVPPWRYREEKPHPKTVTPRRQLPPVVDPPIIVKDDSSEQLSEPLLPRAAIHNHRSTFKPRPRMPDPIHIPTMSFNTNSKFKPLPGSKPWASDFKRDSITPKFAMHDDKPFSSPNSFGKPVRQQFHEQGIMGPHSYKFGYSTGDVENPMARYEEKGADGVVRGSYSYVDARGQKQVVHYESHPKFGFKTSRSSLIF